MLQRQLINNKMFSPDIENPKDQILMGSFCKDCNTIYFPQKRVCPNCMHIDRMEAKKEGLFHLQLAMSAPQVLNLLMLMGGLTCLKGYVFFHC